MCYPMDIIRYLNGGVSTMMLQPRDRFMNAHQHVNYSTCKCDRHLSSEFQQNKCRANYGFIPPCDSTIMSISSTIMLCKRSELKVEGVTCRLTNQVSKFQLYFELSICFRLKSYARPKVCLELKRSTITNVAPWVPISFSRSSHYGL